MILKWIKKMCSSAQEKIFGSYERCYTEQEYSGMLLWVYAVV